MPYNEVYLEKPAAVSGKGKYVRLDSYNPAKGEIISRKFTQFDEIEEFTGKKYIDELSSKYNIDTKIANVPSNQKILQYLVKDGKKPFLQGQMILEIPVQKNGIPAAQSLLTLINNKK